MTAASQLPMVKVNREEFLKTRFKDSPYLDKIIVDGPTAVFTTKALRKEAEKIINDMTTKFLSQLVYRGIHLQRWRQGLLI